jgi:hypothetical protein
MTYIYPDYVYKEKITLQGDSKNNLRYLLEIPLKNEGNKTVLAMMKNPSLADQHYSDHTINRLLTFCHSKGYSKVYVMNLYAYYSTDPEGIAKLIESDLESFAVGNDNNKILCEISKKVDDIIVAWGGNTFGCTTEYKNRILEVVKLIEREDLHYVQSLSKCGWYPRHAQVWSVKSKIEMYRWEPPFQVKSDVS